MSARTAHVRTEAHVPTLLAATRARVLLASLESDVRLVSILQYALYYERNDWTIRGSKFSSKTLQIEENNVNFSRQT